jgi:hypothetical protein
MRKAATSFAVLIVLGAVALAADAFSTLNTTQKETSEQVMSAVTAGSTPYGPAVTAFRKLSATARATIVQELGAWMKTYVSSPAFRTDYTAYRSSQKPEPPDFQGTVDDEFKRKQAETMAGFAETRKNLGLLPADQRKQLEDVMKQSEAQLNSPEMQKLVRDGIVADRASQQESYKQALADWQTRLPENPNPLVAKRLRAFLDTTADIDFAAQLAPKDGKMRFVNPKHEARSTEWKLYFRAGKEAVGAARTIAAAWLKELGG